MPKAPSIQQGGTLQAYTFELDWTVLICVMWQSMIAQYCYVWFGQNVGHKIEEQNDECLSTKGHIV